MAFARIGELTPMISFIGKYDKNDRVRKNEIDNTIIQKRNDDRQFKYNIYKKWFLMRKMRVAFTLKSKNMT